MADTTDKKMVQLELDFNSTPAHDKVNDLDKSIGNLQKSANAVTLYNLGKSAELVKKQLNDLVVTMQKMNNRTFGGRNTLLGSYSSMRRDRTIDVEFEVVNDKQAKLLEGMAKSSEKVTDNIKNAAKESTMWSKVIEELTSNWEKRLAIFLSYRVISLIQNTIGTAMTSMVDLQAEFANIQAIVNATDADMASLSQTIYEVGNNSRFSTEELAKATVTLGQAGLTANQIKDALASVNTLASATGANLSQAVDITTTAMGAWNMQASQAADIADSLTVAVNRTKADITTMANAVKYAGVAAADMGVSWQEFIATASAVTDVGLKGTNVGTGFRSVLTELVRPSERLQKVFKRLGIDIDNVNVEANGLGNTLQMLKDAGLGASEAFEGFDRRAATFYIAASDQLDTTNKLRDAFIEEGAALKANETQMNTLSAQWERFKNISKDTIGEAFKPILELLTSLLKMFNDLTSTGVGKFITKVALLANTTHLLSKAFGGLVPIIQKGWAEALKLNTTITASTALTGKWAKAVLYLRTAFLTLFRTLKSFGVGLLIAGVAELYEKYQSRKDAPEQLQNQYDEQKERMDSLNSVYNELIDKQKLYSTDSTALALRIAEVNKQLKLQGGEALKLTSTYDQLTEAILRKSAAESKAAGRTALSQSREIANQYITNLPANASEMLGVSTEDFYSFVNKYVGTKGASMSLQSILYQKFYSASDAELLKLSDELNKMAESETKEIFKKVRDDALRAKELYQTYLDAFGFSEEDTSAILREIISDEQLATNSGEKFLNSLKTLFKSKNIASLPELFETSNAVLLEIENAIISAKARIEDLKSKGFGPTSTEMVSANKALTDLTGAKAKIEERREKEVNESLRKRMENFTQRLRILSQSATLAQNKLKRWETNSFGRSAKLANAYSNLSNSYAGPNAGAISTFMAQESGLTEADYQERITAGYQKRKAAIAGLNTNLQETLQTEKRILATQAEIDNALKQEGLTEDETLRLKEKKSEIDRQVKEINTSKDNIQTSIQQLQLEQESLIVAKKYNEAKAEARDVAGSFGAGAFDGAIKSIQNYISVLKDAKSTMEEISSKTFTTFADNFADAVVSFANSEKSFSDAMREFVSNTLKEIGNWLIQMSLKAVIYAGLKSMAPGLFAFEGAAAAPTPAAVPKAAGGLIRGGTPNRDSVNAKLMPGEYVLKKSAVDYLGENFLNGLNNNASQTLNSITPEVGVLSDGAGSSVVNVWVVSDKDEAGMGPNDIIATISKDIRTGGTTRQLIKSVVAGRR